MSDNPIKAAIKLICAEKGLSEESVLETVNSALAAAYRKDFADKMQNVAAEFNLETGELKIFDVKDVVEDLTEEEAAAIENLRLKRDDLKIKLDAGEISAEDYNLAKEQLAAETELVRKFNPRAEIQLKDAKAIKKKYKLGDQVKTELTIPGEFGRMAAQTAKQVIIQRLREAERNVTYQEYKDKEGKILNVIVQKFDGRNVIVDLDSRTAGIILPHDQVKGERYRTGDKLKVFIVSVALGARGPEIIASRAHPKIVRQLFHMEIPEVADGNIEIKGIAREAGSRTKIAVFTPDANIDPIGSCIGQRGARIQTIIHELGGEKIDIIEFSDDAKKFIVNSLLPAKISSVELHDAEKVAVVTVPQDQLSLTIGRAGQNVRLASKLTGWKISIKEQESGAEVAPEISSEAEAKINDSAEEPKKD